MSSGKLRDRLRQDMERTGDLEFMKAMKRELDARLEYWESDELRIVRRAGELVEVPRE